MTTEPFIEFSPEGISFQIRLSCKPKNQEKTPAKPEGHASTTRAHTHINDAVSHRGRGRPLLPAYTEHNGAHCRPSVRTKAVPLAVSLCLRPTLRDPKIYGQVG